METSSVEFMDAFRSGHDAAWKAIFAEYYRLICYHLYSKTTDIDEAKEIAQITFLKLYQFRDKMESLAHIKNTLYLISSHQAISMKRSVQNRDTIYGEMPEDVMVQVENSELIDGVMAALEELTPKERAILFKRSQEYRSEGNTHDNTFYIQVCRIRAKMRKLIANRTSLQ